MNIKLQSFFHRCWKKKRWFKVKDFIFPFLLENVAKSIRCYDWWCSYANTSLFQGRFSFYFNSEWIYFDDVITRNKTPMDTQKIFSVYISFFYLNLILRERLFYTFIFIVFAARIRETWLSHFLIQCIDLIMELHRLKFTVFYCLMQFPPFLNLSFFFGF